MRQQTFKIKYQDFVPLPSNEDKNVLKESLLQHGQREPIIINQDGYILDGHTRYNILSERGIKIKYEVKVFESKEEEELYVIDCNLARRHLNAFQKIELVYDIYKLKKKQMGRGGNNIGKPRTGGASAIIGRTIGVNRNLVQMGAAIIDSKNQTLIDKLRRSVIGIDRAYKILNEPTTIKRRETLKKSNNIRKFVMMRNSLFKNWIYFTGNLKK